ncbi:MAG: lipid-A-disaccharide synthase [Desulfonatronovibrionaceae bacterium]
MSSIWLNVGEASSDVYGALVCKYLRENVPQIECTGMGGPEMRRSGLRSVLRSEDLSVMGITEVVSALPRILGMLGRIKAEMRRNRPAAVFVFDCPDFNFRVVKAAHSLDIPVYYCIAPKAWAWRKGRVRFLRKYVKELLCIFPFEEDFFREHGVNASYIGHPLLQVLPGKTKSASRPGSRLAVLPGSRKMEIQTLVPVFASACRILKEEMPELKPDLIRAPGVSEEELLSLWPSDVPVHISSPEDRHERIQSSAAALAASGTVTLECALLGVPTVVAYRVSALTYTLGRMLVDIPYVSMPNLILNQEVFPEFLQDRLHPGSLSAAVRERMQEGRTREEILTRLSTLRERLGRRNAVQEIAGRAAREAGQAAGGREGA